MTIDQLEFSISQYLDGTLDEAERVALEARLENDSEARGLLAEYRAVHEGLRAFSMPAVRWEQLAQSLSAAVAQAPEPAQSYTLPWRVSVPLGLAASLMIAAGVAIRIYHAGTGVPAAPHFRLAAESVAVVAGPQADVPGGPVQIEVSIGAGKSLANGSDLGRYADDMIVRPARVLVASGAKSDEDSPVLPY